jgi:hypothetical protein
VRFLRRHHAGPASAWWNAIADYPHGAPGIVRELLHSRSVVCDTLEAEQALAWAQAQLTLGRAAHPPLRVVVQPRALDPVHDERAHTV